MHSPSSVIVQCSFFEFRQYKIVYRRYASLFFMMGVDEDEVRPGQHLRLVHCAGRASTDSDNSDQHPRHRHLSDTITICPHAHISVFLVRCALNIMFLPCAQNELAMLEFIHCFVEVLDKHFGQVCELDIMNEPEMVSGWAGGWEVHLK